MQIKKSSNGKYLILFGVLALVIGLPLASCLTCGAYTVIGTSVNSHPTLRRGEKCESTSQCEGSTICRDGICK